MTGYGKAEYIFSDHKTIVELRAVNSKQLDLTLKLYPRSRTKKPYLACISCIAGELSHWGI